MDEFPEVTDNTHRIKDLIIHIQQCNHDINQLQIDKQKSEEQLRGIFSHNKEGAATYAADRFKVTITTGLNYKFDKKKYLELMKAPEKIDPKFQLVKEVVELQLNKKAIRECDEYGTPQDRYLKSLFITTSEKKLHVSIKDVKDESIADDVGTVDADGVFSQS